MSDAPGMRIEFADSMRAIAILGVLVIHSATRYACSQPFATIAEYSSHLCRPCIGIFLFLSGFLLANRNWDFSQLVSRLGRVWGPYALFSIAAFLYEGKEFPARLLSGDAENWARILVRFCIGHSFGIYYFVFVITATYLFHFAVQKYRISHSVVLSAFAVVTVLHNLFYQSYFSAFSDSTGYFRTIYELRYIFWPFYFYLGAVANEHFWIDRLRLYGPRIAAVWFLSACGYVCAISCGLHADGYDSLYGTAYTILTIGVMSVSGIKIPCARYVSDQSYFIYLSHIFVVYALRDAGIFASLGVSSVVATGASILLSLIVPLALLEMLRVPFGRSVSRALGGV